jgi:hypothetical protein
VRATARKNKWVLAFQACLITLACIAIFMVLLLTHIHSFLAPSSPIQADVLVVEGWMEDYALKQAITEFNRGGYQKLITTGLPLEQGFYLAQYKNFAELAAATLIELGFERDKLVAVPAPNVIKNRTATSAVALRQWIDNSDFKINAINLFTFDVHSRRSWLIFRQALAPKIKVGVIAVKPLSYNPKEWWISSEGVRSVIGEAIAYIYARLVDWRA